MCNTKRDNECCPFFRYEVLSATATSSSFCARRGLSKGETVASSERVKLRERGAFFVSCEMFFARWGHEMFVREKGKSEESERSKERPSCHKLRK